MKLTKYAGTESSLKTIRLSKLFFIVLLAICFILLCIAGILYCVFQRKNRNVSDPEKGHDHKKVALELQAKPNEPVLIGSLLNIKDESTYL